MGLPRLAWSNLSRFGSADRFGIRGQQAGGFLFMAGVPMTMQQLRIPGRKRRPHFAPDVPSQVRRVIWIKWLRQQASSERPFFALSSGACLELAEMLESL